MKNSKLKFSEYMQNISRSKSFGKFVLTLSVDLKFFTKAFIYFHSLRIYSVSKIITVIMEKQSRGTED